MSSAYFECPNCSVAILVDVVGPIGGGRVLTWSKECHICKKIVICNLKITVEAIEAYDKKTLRKVEENGKNRD